MRHPVVGHGQMPLEQPLGEQAMIEMAIRHADLLCEPGSRYCRAELRWWLPSRVRAGPASDMAAVAS
jgi:hypothetical protein